MPRWSGLRRAALALALLPVAAKADAQAATDKYAELSAQANNPNAPLLQTYLPLVLQVGKVVKLGRHGLSLSAEAGPWVAHPDPPYPVWGVRISAGLLFPGVSIGKGKKKT
jgi:hypothetical protein